VCRVAGWRAGRASDDNDWTRIGRSAWHGIGAYTEGTERMDDRPRRELVPRPRFWSQASGLTSWHSRDAIMRARRRARWTAGGLLAAALLWPWGLTDSSADTDAVVGVLTLEGVTLVVALYASVRAARLSRQVYDVDRLSDQEQATAALALSRGDELLRRLSRLVESLDPGPLCDAGNDALGEAGDVVELRSKVVQRLTQLGGIAEVMGDQAAEGPMGRAVATCRAQIADLDKALDELATAITRLIDAAGTGTLRNELGELREATERVALIAEAMAELELGGIADAPPGTASVPPAAESRTTPTSDE
jgi:hypothetical protein